MLPSNDLQLKQWLWRSPRIQQNFYKRCSTLMSQISTYFSLMFWQLFKKICCTLSQVSASSTFCLIFSVIINTFVPCKLRFSSRMKKVQILCFKMPLYVFPLQWKKVQILCFEMPLYCFRFQYTTKNRNLWGFCIAADIKTPRWCWKIVVGVISNSEWRKDVNISHYKSS